MPELPSEDPAFESKRRKLRLSAFGVLVVLALSAVLLLTFPHDGSRTRVFPLVIADVAFASVICMILVFTLRKR